MYNIRQQNINKHFVKSMRAQHELESKVQGRRVPMREIKQIMTTKAIPIDPKEVELTADNLVTCKEFMASLKRKKFIKPIKSLKDDKKKGGVE